MRASVLDIFVFIYVGGDDDDDDDDDDGDDDDDDDDDDTYHQWCAHVTSECLRSVISSKRTLANNLIVNHNWSWFQAGTSSGLSRNPSKNHTYQPIGLKLTFFSHLKNGWKWKMIRISFRGQNAYLQGCLLLEFSHEIWQLLIHPLKARRQWRNPAVRLVEPTHLKSKKSNWKSSSIFGVKITKQYLKTPPSIVEWLLFRNG